MGGLLKLIVIGFALFGASVAMKKFFNYREAEEFFKPYKQVDKIIEDLQDPIKAKSLIQESRKYERCKDGYEFFVMRSIFWYGYPIDINLKEGTVSYYGDGAKLWHEGREYVRENYVKKIPQLCDVQRLCGIQI